MANPHGSFVWYELITTDLASAGRFYAAVMGWSAAPFPGPGPAYTIFSAGADSAGGMMALPPAAPEQGLRPGWYGYLGVDDVDAAIARITGAGGQVRMPATDLPGVGRIAMVSDPQGVAIYLMRAETGNVSTAFAPERVGHCAWNELTTPDPAAALGFYADQFGWTSTESMPMGDAGDYQFLDHAGQRLGALMPCPEGKPPGWNFYVHVDEIDAAAKRTTDAGGTLVAGPHEVPGNMHIIIATDPQGLRFSLVGPRR